MQTAKIVSIKPIGKCRTIDIEVDHKDHIFYGNGIATSNSHSIAYGKIGYDTAYCKAHFPILFFKELLYWSKEDQDTQKEIRDVVKDCKYYDIDVKTPDIRKFQAYFFLDGPKINFGLCNVRGIGEKNVNKLINTIRDFEGKLGMPLGDWSWTRTAMLLGGSCSISILQALVKANAFAYTGIQRYEMARQLQHVGEFTDKEMAAAQKILVQQDYETISLFLADNAKSIASTAPRLKKLRSIYTMLQQTNSINEDVLVPKDETYLLGTAVSFTKLASKTRTKANMYCVDLMSEQSPKGKVAVEIDAIRSWKIKSGKNKGREMAILTIYDETEQIEDVKCFANEWEKLNSLLFEGNTVILECEKSSYIDGIIVKNAWQI